jgi:hypothetical protein
MARKSNRPKLIWHEDLRLGFRGSDGLDPERSIACMTPGTRHKEQSILCSVRPRGDGGPSLRTISRHARISVFGLPELTHEMVESGNGVCGQKENAYGTEKPNCECGGAGLG